MGNSFALALLLDRRSFTIRLTTSGRRRGFERPGKRGDCASACDINGEGGGELNEIMVDNYTGELHNWEKGEKRRSMGGKAGVACMSYGRDQSIFGKNQIPTLFWVPPLHFCAQGPQNVDQRGARSTTGYVDGVRRQERKSKTCSMWTYRTGIPPFTRRREARHSMSANQRV